MSPPIRDGSGNDIGAIRLGDGSEISEVRTGAGDVLFSGFSIPDSGVSRFLWEQNATDEWGSVTTTDNTSVGYSSTKVKEGSYSKEFNGGLNSNVDFSSTLSLTSFTVATYIYTRSEEDGWVPFMGTKGNSNNHVSYRQSQRFMTVEFDDTTTPKVDYSDDSEDIEFNTWHFLVWAYDGSTLECYIDGSSVGTSSASSKTLKINNIGVGINANGYGFDGFLDQTDIYDKRLSDTEVSNLYATGSING